jgi:signal transduction histidine kinase
MWRRRRAARRRGENVRLGLNLRVSLIVVPLVGAMLALALAPIRSYVRLRTAVVDVRRELAFVLHLCRFDILAVRQSVEVLGVAFLGEDAGPLEALAADGRATLDALGEWELAPRQVERLGRIERAYARLTEAGERAIELARRGEREAATRLFAETIDAQRDGELLPLVDAAQIEGSLALRKALDGLLATSSQLAAVPPLARLEADARSLRREAAEAVSLARLARQAQRLLGEHRSFPLFGGAQEALAVAGHDFDRAYMIWEAQVAGGEGVGGAAAAGGAADVGAEVRAVKEAIDRLAGPGASASQLAPLGEESLPRVLAAAFDAYDARISTLLDSIAMQSRVGGAVIGAVAALALALALGCPWLISRWIVRPVVALTRAARELGAGGGGAPVAVRAGGEIGELAASFDRMAEQLAERTRELEAERGRERLRHAERLAAVGSLAAGLAHQINNPLNNILLTAQDALGEEGPQAARVWRDALAASADEAKRCERIVRGLVAFARGEPGQKWREDAHQVLRRACELTADAAARHGATVELRLGREPAPVLANPIALEQALVNVLRNAIQSRPGARVTLASERRARSVRLEIRDDGRGMDRSALGRLFDPFYTTRADEGGIGLGLSVAHRIVTDHGGEIRVASRPGEGTTVTVDLPLDPDRAERGTR